MAFDFSGPQAILKNVPNKTPEVGPGILGRATLGHIPDTPECPRTVGANVKIGKRVHKLSRHPVGIVFTIPSLLARRNLPGHGPKSSTQNIPLVVHMHEAPPRPSLKLAGGMDRGPVRVNHTLEFT
eukprot:7695834-Pyramimonas_sp.AAC.1